MPQPAGARSPLARLLKRNPFHLGSSFPRKQEPRAGDERLPLDPRFRGGDEAVFLSKAIRL